MAKTAFPDLAKNISMTMTPMVFTARMMKQKDPDRPHVLHRTLRRQEAGGFPPHRPQRCGLRADL